MNDDQFDADRLDRMAADLEMRRLERREKAIAENGPANGWIKKDAEEIFTLDGQECWIYRNQTLWDQMDSIRGRIARAADDDALGKVLKKSGWQRKWPEVGYNGYAVFQQKPVVEPGYKGIIAYVPVHGGHYLLRAR